MCVCVFTLVGTCKSQRLTSGCLPQSFTLSLFEIGSLTGNLVFSIWTRLGSQWGLRICLSLPPPSQHTVLGLQTLLPHVCTWGCELGSSRLQSKLLTHWACFPAPLPKLLLKCYCFFFRLWFSLCSIPNATVCICWLAWTRASSLGR